MADAPKYVVWNCKLIIEDTEEAASKVTDQIPRKAAVESLPNGVRVVACFSDWNGKLTKREKDYVEELERARANV